MSATYGGLPGAEEILTPDEVDQILEGLPALGILVRADWWDRR